MANLTFKYGAMNSGKSTALIQTAYNYRERGGEVLVIKPGIDTKGGETIVSRAGLIPLNVDLLVAPEAPLREEVFQHLASRALDSVDCILADEAQFFTAEQVDDLQYIAKIDDIAVIAHGIRTDFQGNGFPGSLRLLETADKFEEQTTICSCKKKARFNARKINGIYVFKGDQTAIDGVDDVGYESFCGTCFLTLKAKALAA